MRREHYSKGLRPQDDYEATPRDERVTRHPSKNRHNPMGSTLEQLGDRGFERNDGTTRFPVVLGTVC
jgi:hypothetical protein